MLCSGFVTILSITVLAILRLCTCAEECLSLTDASLRFSAVSWWNASGHLTVQATVHHTGAEPIPDAIPIASKWVYDLDFRRKYCGKRDVIETVVTATAPPRRVGSDYTYYPGVGFYKLHETKKNWYNAKKTCEEERAHLCIINSEKEERVVKEILTPHATKMEWVHIGFHDIFKEGHYLTVFDEPLESIGYTNWFSGQPNDLDNSQDCGAVRISGEINDVGCDSLYPFLCEQMLW